MWRLVIWIGMAASVWFYLMAVYGAWDFFRHRRSEDESPGDWSPAVTVLKPLKGLDPTLYDNLTTFCRQQYPVFQILFGVAEASDPAIGVVRRLQREFPDLDIGLVVDSRLHGTNYKISNLINMYGRAKHDIIVLSDSDIRVPPDHLRRMVAPLREERIGLVSCLYRARAADESLQTAFESLFINTDFLHQILVARKIETPRYAFGASMALRRATLEAVGGFPVLANLLADDYYLGHRIAEKGLDLWLSDSVVDTVLDVGSWRHLLQHQMRWARTYRSCRPGGYFCTILTHGTLWAVLNVLVAGLSGTALALSGVVLATRALTTAYLSWTYLGTNLGISDLLLVFAKDLFLSGVWLGSFLGNGVWWSGRRFRILKSGEMELIGVEPRAEAVDVAVKHAS